MQTWFEDSSITFDFAVSIYTKSRREDLLSKYHALSLKIVYLIENFTSFRVNFVNFLFDMKEIYEAIFLSA